MKMIRYSIDPNTIKYVKKYGFLSFTRYLSNEYGKKLVDTATKAWFDALKTASKKLSTKQLKQQQNLLLRRSLIMF